LFLPSLRVHPSRDVVHMIEFRSILCCFSMSRKRPFM
jgi:hypothetical protein